MIRAASVERIRLPIVWNANVSHLGMDQTVQQLASDDRASSDSRAHRQI